MPRPSSARNARNPPADSIVVRGARVHNLKNISLTVPRNRLVVLTGVSGSGKSSLAFDTIYAEGQRRYVESLSSYARQFLERMDKPDVDLIQGISPALAIEQKTNTRNPRSTVGTTTEVYDYLRLLYARIGTTFCSSCGREVRRDSIRTVLASLAQEADGKPLRIHVAFPLPVHPKETLPAALRNVRKEGFVRVLVGRTLVDLNEGEVPPGTKAADVLVVVDRLVFREGEDDQRFADSFETAFAAGNGRAMAVGADSGRTLRFDRNFACPDCHIRYEEPEPRLFSFNNPFGACPECQGFGRSIGIDMDLVIPDRSRSIADGAIAPWTTPKFLTYHRALMKAAPKAGVRTGVPFSELTAQELAVVMEGKGEFGGIAGFFKEVERKSYKIYYRVLQSRYRGYATCPACGGGRLRKEALQIRIAGENIAGVVAMTIARARAFLDGLRLAPHQQEIARRILAELRKRLAYLDDVGIGYLTLDRLSSTLSGGESQRINLATSLGSSLVGALYVLDEPSIGLHPRDTGRLMRILKALRDAGNSVLVVEHDADVMRGSDVIVDMGPRAGEQGGEVVYNGPAAGILDDVHSLTGQYLSGRLSIPVPARRRKGTGRAVVVRGAAHNNLRAIDVTFPLNMLVCVTGVSGSGKSTLVHDVLCGGLRRLKGDFSGRAGAFRAIEGHEHLTAVELVDQSPIGRTPRSNPVTYIGAFDHVRALFAATQAAKVHGFPPGHFSFNVPGGRCDTCEGDGVIRVEMQFLADLELPCDVCKGKRYKQEILEVAYHGRNIADVLSMTVSEAIAFFGAHADGRKLAQKLRILDEVGLGYVRLGQSSSSLSGGEAQRVKLAAHLAVPDRGGHTLFVFDEPTTGLHFDDIRKLLTCLSALIGAGHSVVLIEHHPDVIKSADWVIDLGPEAGAEGGRVVAAGTPEQVARVEESHTGIHLRAYLPPG